jgi:prepilin-type N-terminal cleavage/methylation domain-containing protein
MMRSPRGFTLLEVAIVIGMFVVMMAVVIQFFITYSTSYLVDRATMSVASSAGSIVNEVTELGYSADQILNSHSFGGTTYTTDATTLVLELPAINASGVVISSVYDYVVFYRVGESVYRLLEAGTGSNRTPGTKLLSDSVTSFGFTYDHATPSQASTTVVSVTAQKVVHGAPVRSQLSNTVHLRNFSL